MIAKLVKYRNSNTALGDARRLRFRLGPNAGADGVLSYRGVADKELKPKNVGSLGDNHQPDQYDAR